MKLSWLRWCGVAALAVAPAFALEASGQKPKPAAGKQQTLEIQGRIAKTGQGQFVVATSDSKQITVLTRPQTKFLLNNKTVAFADLRVGTNVTAVYVLEGDRYIADTVTIVTESAADGTLIEGEIVRVVGEDQVIVRTPERKEVIVFVDPRTTYMFENRTGRFTDLRPGASVRVDVNIHEGRHTARQIAVPKRR